MVGKICQGEYLMHVSDSILQISKTLVTFLQFFIRPLTSKGLYSNSKYSTITFVSNMMLIKFNGYLRVDLCLFLRKYWYI